MRRTIGALAAEHVAVGLVENNKVLGSLQVYPEKGKQLAALREMPAENIAECIREQIETVAKGEKIETIGIGFPGIIRDGLIEESPNLQQVKGFNLGTHLTASLRDNGIPARVFIFNDADVMAAGIAATRGHLDRFIRAWTLGEGIGFGRYPWKDGVWEGGHSVVTLDPKEHFCGCGGQGHLEGIMGYRSMRLRFLDMEPEEVFENAGAGDDRCVTFLRLWHRALAAATATSVHMDGPGKFFISGPNAKYIDLRLLNLFLHEMVKMSPLQGSLFEVISVSDEIGVIGAGVNAEHAAAGSY
jgi:predicted NBD/HSP70 family sugar kinase